MQKTRDSLLHLRQQTAITTNDLMRETGLQRSDVYLVEIGGFVKRDIAEKVVNAFSRLSGRSYTVDDIRFQNVAYPQQSTKKRYENHEVFKEK